MTESNRNNGFAAATGFGHDEEEYLAKNAVDFHLLESSKFLALSEIWLETIWQQQVLYWPPEDRTDNGLRQHRKRVHYALRWLFDALDPDVRQQRFALCYDPRAQDSSPRSPETRHSTVPPTHIPRIDVVEPPTPEEIAKSMAVKAAKYAIRARLRCWKEDEACCTRWLARSQHIQDRVIPDPT
ncbi:hypothetical protein EDD18DRAFT_1348151 [Armillaria luteobubalina]|uniref:Uncharacterized protein n=1 Tax=Armillaria luteobubalina TaxID=153913 RepID=A0AA39QET3_9AGAR|nr:hypothetical protein EDD18DRAFT_1348151 [Armillaria luteobubalina]